MVLHAKLYLHVFQVIPRPWSSGTAFVACDAVLHVLQAVEVLFCYVRIMACGSADELFFCVSM